MHMSGGSEDICRRGGAKWTGRGWQKAPLAEEKNSYLAMYVAGVMPSLTAGRSHKQPKHSFDTGEEESEKNTSDTGPDPPSPTID